MQYLHTMVRVRDLDASLAFYCDKLGLAQVQARLQALQAAHGERFAPSAQLARCVREGRSLTSHTS